MMKKMMLWVAVVLSLAAFGASGLAQEATQTESWTVEIDGRKTWTVRYGFGDSLALAGASISPGQFTLDQTMAVDFTATALEIFRVEGHFDDQESADLQSLSLYVDTENLHGVVGDFTAPNLGSFFTGSRTMVGARADYVWEGGEAVGIASRLSGSRDSRQYLGQTATGERTFEGRQPDEGVSYATSLDGLGYVELENLYAEGFTETDLAFEAGASMQSLLEQYGVADLAPALDAFDGQLLDGGEVVVVGTEPQHLLLRLESKNLVREGLRQAIRDYNASDAEDTISYPFVVGSDVEEEFLTAMIGLARLVVGNEVHALAGLRWERFFGLGQEDVEAGSVRVAVSVRGEDYIEVGDPDLIGYAVTVFAEAGVVDAAFPEDFFLDPDASLRVTFSYPVTGGAYFLGASVIPGSERVTMAGRILAKDVDYSIEYEVGLLVLLVDIGPSDLLVVEFERYAGTGSYGRTFYGATLSIPAGDDVALTTYLLRGVDERATVTHPESVKTMPNTQTVVGIAGTVAREDLRADFALGYADDVFPYDDNERNPVANRVNAFASASDMVFVGHDAGFSAMASGEWRAYGTGSGLSGREVRALAADGDRVFLGTEGGLTVVDLVGVAPLDKVANWSRYGKTDGLLHVSVRALVLDGDVLWIGTDEGLFRVGTGDLDDPDAWVELDDAALQEIRALCIADDVLYVGTEVALVRVDRADGDVLSSDVGDSVADLATDGASVYAAGDLGLRRFEGGAFAEWVAQDVAVLAVEAWDGDVFYGTDAGMSRASDGETFHGDWTVTALGAAGGALWAGTQGDATDELMIWRRAAAEAGYGAATTGIDPTNPRVYSDVMARDHSATGWTVAGSFSHEGDGYSIDGAVDRVLPGFRAIDSRSRTDEGGWSLATDIELGAEATLSFDHSYRLSDVGTDDARAEADNKLVLRGTFGPEISLTVDYAVEDTSSARGFEKNGLSYDLDVGHTLFDDAVTLSIGWGEGFRWDEGRTPRRDTALTASATWNVLPDLRTTLSLSRPVRIVSDSASGSERWRWQTAAAFDLAGAACSGTYEMDASRSLPGGVAAFTHDATLGVTMPAIALGEWSLSPTLDLEGGLEQGIGAAEGRFAVRTTAFGLTTRTTASLGVTGLGSPTERWTEKLTSSASYSGIEDLRPTLNYSGARTVTKVEDQGEKVTWSHTVNGRVTWAGDDGTSEVFTLNGRVQSSGSASVSVANTFSTDVTAAVAGWIPALADAKASESSGVVLRTDVGADWRRDGAKDDVSWRVGAAGDLRLSETWGLSFGLTYRGGAKTSVDPFHGLVAEMTVAIDF